MCVCVMSLVKGSSYHLTLDVGFRRGGAVVLEVLQHKRVPGETQ